MKYSPYYDQVAEFEIEFYTRSSWARGHVTYRCRLNPMQPKHVFTLKRKTDRRWKTIAIFTSFDQCTRSFFSVIPFTIRVQSFFGSYCFFKELLLLLHDSIANSGRNGRNYVGKLDLERFPKWWFSVIAGEARKRERERRDRVGHDPDNQVRELLNACLYLSEHGLYVLVEPSELLCDRMSMIIINPLLKWKKSLDPTKPLSIQPREMQSFEVAFIKSYTHIAIIIMTVCHWHWHTHRASSKDRTHRNWQMKKSVSQEEEEEKRFLAFWVDRVFLVFCDENRTRQHDFLSSYCRQFLPITHCTPDTITSSPKSRRSCTAHNVAFLIGGCI